MVKDTKFYKSLLFLAIPVAFQNLITFGVNMMDTVMVGSLGDITLSATSLANQVSTFLMMFVRGVSGGTAVLISQYWGKKDFNRIKSVFGIGFKTSFCVSTLFTLFVFLFPQFVMSLFSNEAAVIVEGAKYLKIVCFSYILFSVSDTFISMLRCVEIVKIALAISTVSFFLNISSNYVLIFGKLGFPAMGIEGAALATVFTRCVELVIVLTYALAINKKMVIKFSDLLHNDKTMWRDFYKYGVAIIVGDVLWGLVGAVKSSIMGRLGSEVVSAVSITEVFLQLATMFIFGLASAACVIIGKTVGAGNYQKAKQYSKTLQILFLSLGILASLVTFFIKDLAISFYDVSPLAKEYARQMFIVGAITIWGTSYAASCFTGINRGAGDGNFVVKTDMIFGWLVVIPLTAFAGLVFGLPPAIVFFFSRCDQILKVIVAFFRLRTNKWIKNVTRN